MTVESAWTDAVKQWAAHHDATAPVRPPAGELSERERQRYIAQARRLGQHVERLKAENERLSKALDVARSDAREDYERAERAESELATMRARHSGFFRADL